MGLRKLFHNGYNIIKNFLANNYGYVIIMIALIYGSYLIFIIYQDIYEIFKSESDIFSQKQGVLDMNLYETYEFI